MKRVAFFIILAATLGTACKKGLSSPTTPSTTPTEPTPTRIIALSGNLAFGDVTVGLSASATLTISNQGNSTLTITGITGPSVLTSGWTSGSIAAGGSQNATVTFTPTAVQTYNGTATVSGNQTSGTNTIAMSGSGKVPPGGLTQFGAGQYLVGKDVAAGRYFSAPRAGCYWARLSGLGGTLGEILANDFIGFNAPQAIVDILGSDLAFTTDSDCGTWFNSPRRGFAASISPGWWLVGSQAAPGTYRATASSGCYWERLKNFDGTLSAIIANDFNSSGGSVLIAISASDTGFSTDDECGTWTPVDGTSAHILRSGNPQPRADIERNRSLHRERSWRW